MNFASKTVELAMGIVGFFVPAGFQPQAPATGQVVPPHTHPAEPASFTVTDNNDLHRYNSVGICW